MEAAAAADGRLNVVLPDAPNTLSAMWSDLRPKLRISALLRVMRAHEKGSHEVEGEAERLEGCAQVLATLDPRCVNPLQPTPL